METLLSIIVPTKNRYFYLKEMINMFQSYSNKSTELIIQDNSTDNTEFAVYIKNISCSSIYYYYESTPLSIVENMDCAVMHAHGKYICALGDDDIYSGYLEAFVEYMDKSGIESAMFNNSSIYFWPGMHFIVHPLPSLMIQKFKKSLNKISPLTERVKCMKAGAINLGLLPRIYHGVVRRSAMQRVFEQTGTYFPGASPDMASSIALSFYVKNHCYCDVPLIVSGKSPNSVVGKEGRHPANEIKNVRHLPQNIEEMWPPFLPEFWSAGTIWTQSLFEAMTRTGHADELKDFNYAACYANIAVFEGAYRKRLVPFLKGHYLLLIKFLIGCMKLFALRVKVFLKNSALTRFHLTSMYIRDHVENSCKASEIIDQYIKSAIETEK